MLRKIQYCVCLIALTMLVGCTEPDVEIHQWTLQSQATATSVDFRQLQVMADNIRLMSNGRLVITPVPGGQVTNGPDIYTAVKQGRIEMGNGWPNWWSGQHPAWAVMNAGPFDFMNLDASMIFFLAGEGTTLANELSAKDGVIWRAAWWPGMEFGLLSKESIRSLADLNGKRVRVGPGLPSEVLAEAAGVFSIPLVPQEIRPALENGELDAVEWTTTAGAWDLGLQDIARHAIVPAIWQPSVLADFLINQEAYDRLTPDLQRILEVAIHSYTLTTTLSNKSNDIAALQKFRDAGVSIHQWSEQDLLKWRQASDKLYRDYQQRDTFTDRLIKAKRAFKQEYNQYYTLFGPYEKDEASVQ